MYRLFALRLIITSCLVILPLNAALSRQPDTMSYRQAFSAYDSGQRQLAFSIINRGSDDALNKVLRSYAMAQPGNDYSFDELAGFITDHPDWPGLSGIVMIAEQKIPTGASALQVSNWFRAHPPLTPTGFYRYMDALEALGQSQMAETLVRDRWINRDFSSDEFSAFQARFAPLLKLNDHKSRIDRLLWEENTKSVKEMYRFVDADFRAVAEARMALASQSNRAESTISSVPESLRNDPGLLFERLRWRRKNNLDESAIEILTRAPEHLGRPDIWWDERSIIIRRVMEKHDYALAYRLAADHGLTGGFDYLQAEFMSGWLALRAMKRPDLARNHFEHMLKSANTPISRARGEYWLGRSLEALGDKKEAEQSYESAAALNTTFYGQLAIARLYANPTITAAPEPAIPANVRSQFFARDSIRATERLYQIGQTDRARIFFKAATDAADQRVEFVLLMELAYQMQRPDWAINAAKAANQKNMIVTSGSFPVLSTHVPSPPDPAFTHALIRQESLFNSDAKSPAGARGLMQLMPSTAKEIAKKIGVQYHESGLTDPSYNLKLGTAFAQRQLEQFDGSIILSLAAYNAGPRRAREWMDLFGDPRSPKVDPIDWIELMPIYETRNYVQRILENMQVYRARLNGGKAPLLILQDLKR